MGKGKRYSTSFKKDAVEKVVIHGYTVVEASKQLGISDKTLYAWIKSEESNKAYPLNINVLVDEVSRLKSELKKVNKEKDTLRDATIVLAENLKNKSD